MSLAGLSLRDLEYLVAIAECGHFGRAAQQCAVSQPALSAQIKKLEDYLGVQLFERVPGRGVFITAQGERSVQHARSLLAYASALVTEARETTEPLKGHFRLGYIPTLGPYLLPYLLKPLRKAFQTMQLILSEGKTTVLLDDLCNGKLDAVVACAPASRPGLQATTLFFEPFLLMHPPCQEPAWPLVFAEERDLDFETGRFLLLEEGHCLRDHVLWACGCNMQNALMPNVRRHATGLEMLRQMVAAEEGVSLMPALAAKALGPLNDLVAYTKIADQNIGRETVFIVRKSDPRQEPLARMAALFREYTPEPASSIRPRS